MAAPTGGTITTDGTSTVWTFVLADTGTNMTFGGSGRFNKGEHKSIKTEFNKGHIAWNKGLKGVQPSTRMGKLGRKHTDEEKKKIGLSLMGHTGCWRGKRGEGTPNWRGGKGTERQRLMGQTEYLLWRVAVFIRDDYTCQKCNKHGGNMEAHHIKSWNKYPELRYAIDNGQTLCIPCHRQTDSWGFKGVPRAERGVI
jgi:hypothetical protein